MAANMVAGALGAAGQSILNGLSNWLQGKSNVENSKQLMDYQSKKELETQSLLNARLYPQQVASMRMAGLNPAMMSAPMSQGASSPNATQNMPPVSMDLMDSLTAMSAIDLNQAQARNLDADAKLKEQETRLRNEETQYKSFMNDTYWDNYAYTMAEVASRTAKNNSDTEINYQNLKNLQQQLDNLKQALDNARLEGRLTEVNIENAKKIASAEVAKLYSEAKLNVGENKRRDDLNKWQVELTASDTSATGIEMQLKRELTRLTREQVRIIQEYGADSAQAQIIGTYISSIASALNGGASVTKAIKMK